MPTVRPPIVSRNGATVRFPPLAAFVAACTEEELRAYLAELAAGTPAPTPAFEAFASAASVWPLTDGHLCQAHAEAMARDEGPAGVIRELPRDHVANCIGLAVCEFEDGHGRLCGVPILTTLEPEGTLGAFAALEAQMAAPSFEASPRFWRDVLTVLETAALPACGSRMRALIAAGLTPARRAA